MMPDESVAVDMPYDGSADTYVARCIQAAKLTLSRLPEVRRVWAKCVDAVEQNPPANRSGLPWQLLMLAPYPSEERAVPDALLARLDAALGAVRAHVKNSGGKGEWKQRRKQLQDTSTQPRDAFRNPASAFLEVGVLGSMVQQWGEKAQLWPPALHGKYSDCFVDDGSSSFNLEAGGLWSRSDLVESGLLSPEPGQPKPAYERLPAKLDNKLREKLAQLCPDVCNVLFLGSMASWDGRRSALDHDVPQTEDEVISDFISAAGRKGLRVVIMDIGGYYLQHIYVRGSTRYDNSKDAEIAKSLEVALRKYWLVANPVRWVSVEDQASKQST